MDKRKNAAIKIALNPQDYKVCEGCGSIVRFTASICPNCHSYRYNDDLSYIVKHAEILSKSEQKSVTKEDLF